MALSPALTGPTNVRAAIDTAASRYGVDPTALSVIAQLESGGNPAAQNPNSSAGGLFQFIDSTAQQYGLTDKFDPYASADAGARLARDNAASLRRAIGREPTIGELYLAHQQGAGGASTLLANPNQKAIDIVGRNAVLLNGGNEDMSAQEFANLWINKAQGVLGGEGVDTVVGQAEEDVLADGNDARTLAQQLLLQIGTQPEEGQVTPAEAYGAAGAMEPAPVSAAQLEAEALLQDIAPQGENVVMTTEGGGRVVEMPLTGQGGIDIEGRPIRQYSFVSPEFSTTDQGVVQRVMEGMSVQDALREARAAAAEGPTPLREQFSREGFETAGQAAGGLVGGEGVVQIPESVPLYREGGAEVSIPAPVRGVGEYLGDVLMTAAGAGQGAYGYLVGGLGDLLVESGVMDRSGAQRLGRDLMAMPEAFAGSPGALATPRMAAPRGLRTAERVAEEADVAQPPRVAPETPPVTPDEDVRIGELIRRGAGFGIGAHRAREELARIAQANPEAAAAAERLGIDLPVDVLTDSRQIREAVGATRSIAGSEASAAWRDDLLRVTERADEVIQELGGATDLSTVSDRVLTRLTGTRDDLFQRADDLYTSVDVAVPRNTIIEPNNVVRTLNGVIGELGGPAGMTAAERRLFELVTGDQPITYRRLMREKTQIGRAIRRGDGPYADVDQADLSRLYAALSEDQLANVSRVGGEDLRANLELANDLYAQGRNMDTEIVSAFGRDRQGSIASRLRSAISSTARGDVSGLQRTINVIPEDLRREAATSAIREVASSTQAGERGFGFNQFTNFYSSLRRNPQAYRQVVEAVGTDADRVLRDLYEVSRRVTDARANVISTGRANQPLIEAMRAEGLMGRFMGLIAGRRAVQATTTGAGGAAGGPVGAMMGDAFGDMLARARPDRLQRASALFRSDAFKTLMDEVATQPAVSARTVNRVANSRQYRDWAAMAGIEDPRNWLQSAILASTVDQEAVPAEVQQ